MIQRLTNYWKNNKFNIILVVSISIILLLWIYNLITQSKGTYSNSYYYKPTTTTTTKKKSGSKGETICRQILENYFGKPFPNQRPKYMFNNTSKKALELDCYNEGLRLAVEYSGIQHYQYTPYFHRNGPQDFEKQVRRDKLKSSICKKLGITLIIVPYKVSHKKIKPYLLQKLKENGF